MWDCLLEYDFEGQGSSAGSVSSCSLLEDDNDLQFLDDLGTKFSTLAKICVPPRPPTPVIEQRLIIPRREEAHHDDEASLEIKPPAVYGKNLEHSQSVNISQSSTQVTDFKQAASSSVHVQSAQSSRCAAQSSSESKLQTSCAMLPSSGQILLLQQQQPIYYTTTPMLQPMHYIVQPQVQNTMMLAEAPVTNMQGMIMISGASGHIAHMKNADSATGTLTLSSQNGATAVLENQGMRSEFTGGTMGIMLSGQAKDQQSDVTREVMGVVHRGQQEKSEVRGGAMGIRLTGSQVKSENCNTGLLMSSMASFEHQGVGAWPTSETSGAVMGVVLTGQQIKSEVAGEVIGIMHGGGPIKSVGGGMTERCNIQPLTRGHISAAATGSGGGQTVKQHKKQGRTRSTASAEKVSLTRNHSKITCSCNDQKCPVCKVSADKGANKDKVEILFRN